MPTLQLRYPLAALLLATGCAGSATDVDPGEATAESDLALPDGLDASPGAVDFGVVKIGQHGTAQVQLTNTGGLSVLLRPRTVTAGFTVRDNCGRALRGHASCTLDVGFSPTRAGNATGTLTIASPLNSHPIALTGSGTDLRKVTVTVAGTAPGFIYTYDPSDFFAGATLCPQPCTAYIPTDRTIAVLGFTPSRIGGWTDCAGPDLNECDLGPGTDDVALTVTFNRDQHEVATLLPLRPVRGLAFTPSGDVLIADSVGVTRRTLAGSIVWSVAIPGAHDLATDAAGHIYGGSTGGLFALADTGAALWTRSDIAVVPSGARSFQSAVVASPDGSVIAAHLADGAWVVDANGADRFTVHGVSADGLAVAPDGTVAIGKDAPSGAAVAAARFTAQGVPLADFDPIPNGPGVSMAYDASNALVAQTTGSSDGNVVFSRILPDGSLTYSVPELSEAFPTLGGVAIDSLGNAVVGRSVINDNGASGLYFEVVAPGNGAPLFNHFKGTQSRIDILNDGVTVNSIASDAHRHFAFGGFYNQSLPWIQIYETVN